MNRDQAMLVAGMAEAIVVIHPAMGPTQMMSFLLTGQPELHGAEPLQWLAEDGDVAAVLVAFRRTLNLLAR